MLAGQNKRLKDVGAFVEGCSALQQELDGLPLQSSHPSPWCPTLHSRQLLQSLLPPPSDIPAQANDIQNAALGTDTGRATRPRSRYNSYIDVWTPLPLETLPLSQLEPSQDVSRKDPSCAEESKPQGSCLSHRYSLGPPVLPGSSMDLMGSANPRPRKRLRYS